MADLLAELSTFPDSAGLRSRLADLVRAYRPSAGYVHPISPRSADVAPAYRGSPFATLQTFVRQNHPMVIDLSDVFLEDNDEVEEFRDRERMPLREFLDSGFFSMPIEIEIRPDDILMIDEYRDNGLYFVYEDDNGEIMVVKTPGDYMLPPEALGMLEMYNVQNEDDFIKVYDVEPYALDLFGIEAYGMFANVYNGQIGDPGVYEPST